MWEEQMEINHLLFSVSNLDKSIYFYQAVFNAKLLVKGRTTAYLDLNGLWLALNLEETIPRNEIQDSYTHIAFSVKQNELELIEDKLKKLNISILPGRDRDVRDRDSIYFTDPDGHKFEFHTGTLEDRMSYYKETKPNLEFFD